MITPYPQGEQTTYLAANLRSKIIRSEDDDGLMLVVRYFMQRSGPRAIVRRLAPPAMPATRASRSQVSCGQSGPRLTSTIVKKRVAGDRRCPVSPTAVVTAG